MRPLLRPGSLGPAAAAAEHCPSQSHESVTVTAVAAAGGLARGTRVATGGHLQTGAVQNVQCCEICAIIETLANM